VICEYLDGLHAGPKLIAPDGRERFAMLRLDALAKGICEAGIAVRHDSVRRPEQYRYPAMREGQFAKLVEAYDFIENEGLVGASEKVDLGQVALATALSWIEFRQLGDFEKGRPQLSAWYRAFIKRPSMLATPLAGETHD
jgi:glutathione S-transferase